MPDSARCFCALELTESVRAALDRTIDRMRPAGAQVSWVRPASMHVTLKFFGDVARDRLPSLRAALAEVRAPAAIALRVRGLGVFPSRRRPRIVWAGIEGDTIALSNLVERIEADVESKGFARETRPFRAHVTIGRVRGPRNVGALVDELDRRRAEIDLELPPHDSFTLFESDLTPHGPVYAPIERYQFAPR